MAGYCSNNGSGQFTKKYFKLLQKCWALELNIYSMSYAVM